MTTAAATGAHPGRPASALAGTATITGRNLRPPGSSGCWLLLCPPPSPDTAMPPAPDHAAPDASAPASQHHQARLRKPARHPPLHLPVRAHILGGNLWTLP
jgi:hypothetical protein